VKNLHVEKVAAALFVFLLLAHASGAAEPKTVVPEPVVDVGVVEKGAKIEHRFLIRNDGNAPLEIREVEPACGCTVAEFDRVIAPRSSGEVLAIIDTKNFRGPIAKSVTVFTTDPANPRLNLVVKAEVRPQVEARPGYARLIVVEGEPAESSKQWLWSSDGPPLEISKVDSPYPFLKVDFRLADAEERSEKGAEQQWLVEMTLSAAAPVGPLADFVVVHTNHPGQKVVKIPVSGFVRPVVAVKPRRADFGPQDLSEPYSATLEVTNLGSEEISVGAATTDLPGVETEVEEVEAGKLYRVTVRLSPGMEKGPFRGKLEIQTSSERQPVLEVDLTGTVL
jgi:hypothetical protein